MKKKQVRVISAALCLLVMLLSIIGFAPHAQAASDHLIDNAGIFSESAKQELREKIASLESSYQTNVVILTVDGLADAQLTEWDYHSITAFADDYYDYVIAGGNEQDGILLCINMERGNREYCIRTTGSEISRFESKIDYMYDKIYDFLSDGDYDGAARKFVSMVEMKHRFGFMLPSTGTVLICIGVGLLIGWIVTGAMSSKMSNVRKATAAGSYLVAGSYNLRRMDEAYLYRNVTQTRRAQQRSSGGGGGFSGGGHSGISHGGGGGRRF